MAIQEEMGTGRFPFGSGWEQRLEDWLEEGQYGLAHKEGFMFEVPSTSVGLSGGFKTDEQELFLIPVCQDDPIRACSDQICGATIYLLC